jgi:hypothetical protein
MIWSWQGAVIDEYARMDEFDVSIGTPDDACTLEEGRRS